METDVQLFQIHFVHILDAGTMSMFLHNHNIQLNVKLQYKQVSLKIDPIDGIPSDRVTLFQS